MDWLLLDDKINKVMRKVAQLNGDEYHESFYNPHPYPGWCPELKHMMWGFIKELKEKEAAGVTTKVDLETLSELFDVIIRLSDLSLTETKFQQNTNAFGEAVTAFNYKLLNARKRLHDDVLHISKKPLRGELSGFLSICQAEASCISPKVY
ncbi:MAG: hypothetical protein MST01_01265 [Prevotella sp.]|nr:hypothetical protein [Prevotella sp.]